MKNQTNMLLKRALTACAALAVSASSFAATFTNADLKKMVDELVVHLPQHERVKYPIEAKLEENEEVNAYATVRKIPGDDKQFQGVMVVFSGLANSVKGDYRLIRAVVAHELAHLSKGHIFSGLKVQDAEQLFVRQIEYEADLVGCGALVRAGYPKKDMVDMLMSLDSGDAGIRADYRLLGDHAEAKRRAALLLDDPSIMKSQLTFEKAEAFADNRYFASAIQLFEEALAAEPKLKQASANIASCALQDYYYNYAPKTFRETVYQPDFGPMLRPNPTGKLVQWDDAGRRAYQTALAKIKIAQDALPGDRTVMELAGLAGVLAPDTTPATISAGIATLRKVASMATLPEEKLRIANNIAIGLQRQGNVTVAAQEMLEAQKKTDLFSPVLAQNLGQNTISTKTTDDAKLAAAVLVTYLNNASDTGANYKKVEATYKALCAKNKFKVGDYSASPVMYLGALDLVDGSKRYSLLKTPMQAFEQLGKADKKIFLSRNYKQFYELVFAGGLTTFLVEEDTTTGAAIMRATSYNSGAFVELKPKFQGTEAVKVSVGMTVAELSKILPPKMASKRSFIKAGQIEEWTYFPGLNLGVLLQNDKVAGVTVTPAARIGR